MANSHSNPYPAPATLMIGLVFLLLALSVFLLIGIDVVNQSWINFAMYAATAIILIRQLKPQWRVPISIALLAVALLIAFSLDISPRLLDL